MEKIKYKGQVYIRVDSFRTLNDARKEILSHLNKALEAMEDVVAETQIPTHLPVGALRDIVRSVDSKIKEVEKRNAIEEKRRLARQAQRKKEIEARKR